MSGLLFQIFNIIYYALIILIFARVILSWVRGGPYELREWVFRLTEPILAPVRRLLPSSSGLDLSPMIVLLGLYVLRILLAQILF